jgi:hypothetical protein
MQYICQFGLNANLKSIMRSNENLSSVVGVEKVNHLEQCQV